MNSVNNLNNHKFRGNVVVFLLGFCGDFFFGGGGVTSIDFFRAQRFFRGFCLFSPVFSPEKPREDVLQIYLVFVIIISVICIVLYISDVLFIYLTA